MSKFYVVCDDYRMGPLKSRDVAERKVKAITLSTDGCQLPHHIEEVEE